MAIMIGRAELRTEEVIKAIEEKDIEKIKFLLKQNINLSIVNQEGSNIFHILSQINATKEITEILVNTLDKKLLELKNDWGDTPLHSLIRYSNINSIDIAKIYINANSNIVNIISDDFNDDNITIKKTSPLFLAIDLNELEIVKLLITKGANLNWKNEERKTALFYTVGNSHDNNITKMLIEKGADFTINGYEYTSRLSEENGKIIENFYLIDYGWTLLNEAIKSNNNEIVKFLIKQGIDIHEIDENGNSPFKNAYDNDNKEIVKLLINKEGISIKDKYDKELTFIEHAEAYKKSKQWFLNLIEPTPKDLVKILTNFRKDNPIKYTTHDWDNSFMKHYKENYNDFDGFLDVIKQEWGKVASQLKRLSPNLYKKIYSFLLSKEQSHDWYSKSDDSIKIGWSSLEGLKEWCDDGGNPFNYKLPNIYNINDKTITTFGEVVELFKHEIQFRNQHQVFDKEDMLQELFYDFEESLNSFKVELSENLARKEFYTDVEKFTNAINIITKEIKKHKNFKNIKVEILENNENKYYDIKIIHVASESGQNSEDMLKKIEGGESLKIKDNLSNLCDWSIECSFKNENYRINCLSSSNIGPKEPLKLEYKPEGFTHIFRFYK